MVTGNTQDCCGCQNEMLQATANEELAWREEAAQPGAVSLSADDPGAALSALPLLGGTPKLKLHCCCC